MPHSCVDPVFRKCGDRRRTVLLLLSGLAFATTASFPTLAQVAAPVRVTDANPHAAHIATASRRFGIPAAWIVAVMRAESAGDVRAVSSAGAMGLMQVMPETWAELRARYRLGRDPYDPHDNIFAGTAYLREMWDRYGNVAAMLAAYNAGPSRYDEHRATGRPLPAETRAYVASLAPVLRGEGPSKIASAVEKPLDWRESAVFVRDSDAPSVDLLQGGRRSRAPHLFLPATPEALPTPASQGLFVARGDKGAVP
ncbi:transglycosylase SLT domain-containing protein [Mesorhizobium sp. CC13]|uniref:lytic transglycosylase domain-containing protein n=1 Tax=Mesorhizobium sp. CC13 TaxID=3029194 RepID=UPI003264AE2B